MLFCITDALITGYCLINIHTRFIINITSIVKSCEQAEMMSMETPLVLMH